MFFFLSKTVSHLFMPLTVTALCLLFGLILKNKWGGRLRVAAMVLFLFFSNEFIANEVMAKWEVSAVPYRDFKQPFTYGILLTGVTHTDKQPADRVYFQHGADRVVHTVELYKRGIIRHIIVSGGTGRIIVKGRSEAHDIYKALVLMGVPPGHITVESASRNTRESAVAVSEILKHAPGTALLITSAFHMRRSMACFKKCGVEVTAFSTDFYTHPRQFTPDVWLVPQPEAWVIWHKLFKEWIGIAAYRMAGYL
jgi:uncharacterized SAM-binding protein YcdF (DUF218 family)